MTPRQPYILRAMYEWILDNDCTPHLLVNADFPGVEVPAQYVKDGQIVLNISPSAVQGMSMDNETVSFRGRFSGVASDIFLPVSSVMGIYARENGEGVVFENPAPPTDPGPPEDGGGDNGGGRGGKPDLRVVK